MNNELAIKILENLEKRELEDGQRIGYTDIYYKEFGRDVHNETVLEMIDKYLIKNVNVQDGGINENGGTKLAFIDTKHAEITETGRVYLKEKNKK